MTHSIKFMFTAMSEFRLGKASTLFHSMARELGHMVLTNKKNQETRFIRATTRAEKTFMQNLPTLVMVHNTMFKEHLDEKVRMLY